jgi:hypothetical protein
MGAITLQATGQRLCLYSATVQDTGATATVYSDTGLSSPITLPAYFDADYTIYAANDVDLVLTVKEIDGTTLVAQRVKPQSLVTVKPKPLPTTDQMVANTGQALSGKRTYVDRGTSAYSLILDDAGKVVEVTYGSKANLTIPANVFAAGDSILVYSNGAGKAVLTAGAGLTLRNAFTGPRISAQYGCAKITFVSATEAFVEYGTLEADA